MQITDSPGLMWPKIEDESRAFRLALVGSIPDTAIDYLTIGIFGARYLLEKYPQLLLARYKLDTKPPEAQALIEEIGRRRGALKKGGTVDLHKAAEMFVQEVRKGVIGRISFEIPPVPALITEPAPP
jgi:ribosome biogenesis GTPase A